MFIDPTLNPKTCAPAERDVSGNGTRHRLTFRSSVIYRQALCCLLFAYSFCVTNDSLLFLTRFSCRRINHSTSREAAAFSSPVRERGVVKVSKSLSAEGALCETYEACAGSPGLDDLFAVIHALTGRGYSMSALRAFWLRPWPRCETNRQLLVFLSGKILPTG